MSCVSNLHEAMLKKHTFTLVPWFKIFHVLQSKQRSPDNTLETESA